MAISADVGAVLLASIQGSGTGALPGKLLEPGGSRGLARLANAAEYHGVTGYVHAMVQDASAVPESERALLKSRRLQTVVRHLQIVSDLQRLRSMFESAGIDWMVMKGPTLAEPIYGSPELRSYVDLDLVVPGEQLARAVDALEQDGSIVIDRNWPLIHRELKGEIHIEMPSGTALDLHWHLLNGADARETFPLDMHAIFDRRVTVDVGGSDVPTLEPIDTVIYVGLHTMLSGADRLIWLKDVEQLLVRQSISAEQLVERSRSWRAELVLISAISRMQRVLGRPPIVEEIRKHARPARAWSILAATAWRLSPAEREDGSASVGRAVARSVRGSEADTWRAIARKSRHQLRTGGEDGTRGTDPRLPSSDRFEAGGRRERQAFFDAVARSAGR